MTMMQEAIHEVEMLPEEQLPQLLQFVRFLNFSMREKDIATVQPDAWDLRMIKEAQEENDGKVIAIETLADELGIVL